MTCSITRMELSSWLWPLFNRLATTSPSLFVCLFFSAFIFNVLFWEKQYMPFPFKMPVSVLIRIKNCVNERSHPVKVLIASTALVLVGTITICRAFAARLTSFCQKLIQTERILFVFLELDWTAARTRSTTAVGSTELLVRNESTADIWFS